MSYIIRRVGYDGKINDEDFNFIVESAAEINKKFNGRYNWGNMDLYGYAERNYLVFLEKYDPIGAKKIVGAMLYRLTPSVFDQSQRILHQDLLYSRTKKGTYLLLKHFIDFGKNHAHHLITMIGSNTNIKPSSLNKLGFKELETLYRLEV